MNQYTCIICGKPFFKAEKPYRGRRTRVLRPQSAKTCSKDCSRSYTRMSTNCSSVIHRRQFIAGLGGSPKKQG